MRRAFLDAESGCHGCVALGFIFYLEQPMLSHRTSNGPFTLSILLCIVCSSPLLAQQVEVQPLRAQVERVENALASLGQPLSAEVAEKLKVAKEADNAITAMQDVLDPLCIAIIDINAESRVKVEPGKGNRELTERGWTAFLVKVNNLAGVTAKLRARSPNAKPLLARSSSAPRARTKISNAEVEDRWMEIETFDGRPMTESLSGLGVEYRIVQIYSRDAGKREAGLAFDVGQGTQDIGYRNALPVLFEAKPANKVRLSIVDVDGSPTTAEFVIRDKRGRVYPARSRRLEPDFYFHDQIYREDGEELLLPAGTYDVTYSRGPEYLVEKREIEVKDAPTQSFSFRLKRWIHMTKYGWYSGDHHIHAAGCSHYEAPTEGVLPVAMMRHIVGEDLNVGCVLTWGPCWYHQKQFFDGKVHKLSENDNVMRYDVEVSGFPSSHAGHLCLLRLTEDDYPGTTKIEEWPSWDLPVLKWGKEQGGVVGFSHSGWGLEVPSTTLPTYDMPRFDGIGANEYVVDVVHDVCDFISAVDTPIVWELSPWYHTLNCGFTCRISGETDFPCIYDDKVGLGRSYVKLGDKLDFDQWVMGIKAGRSYVGDGLSHLFDFKINDLAVGDEGDGGRPSFLAGKSGDTLSIRVNAAAYLEEQPREDIRSRPLSAKPYWHVERARVDDTRKVPVELIVNGEMVESQMLDADGSVKEILFDYKPEKSSWIAIRIFASSHTNPIFVELDGKPIRADKKSAQWCIDAVDVCWDSKKARIRDSELDDAKAAYDIAKATYQRILEETK